MLKAYKARVQEDGITIRLAEPGTLRPNADVYVSVIESGEDEKLFGGYPVTMLLSASALAKDWDTPEENEAWKEYQDEAKHQPAR